MSALEEHNGLPHGARCAPRSEWGILALVRGQGTQPGLREALETGWRELVLYLAAGAAYVAIGVAAPEFLFTWVVAAGYLLICVVVLPAVARRIFR